MEFPQDLLYSADHEWLRQDGETAVVGITAFAARELGDIVYVDISHLGESLSANAVFGNIEAVKTVSDLFLPAAGTLLEVNPLLADQPELVNDDPYGDGWLIRIRLATQELAGLMNAPEYQNLIGHV